MKEDNRTELDQLGEFALIERLTSEFDIKHKETIVGIGDDGAVLDVNGKIQVISTDLLIEQTHFDMMYTPLRHLGYKAVVINISDICAMNAIPKQITVSIAASNRYSVEALEELYYGIRTACSHYKIDLIGGDTASSPKGLIISVTAIGYADKEQIVKRDGAIAGDLLCVSGDLGGAYLGLQVLEREKRVFIEHPSMQPKLEKHEYAVSCQLKPEARLDVIKQFADWGIKPTSMIDVSNGLVSEVLHLSKSSNIGFLIQEDKLPIDDRMPNIAMEIGLEATLAALHGGEDYELLFTLSQEHYDLIKDHPDISIIGYARDISMGNQLKTPGGNLHQLVAQGWKSLDKE